MTLNANLTQVSEFNYSTPNQSLCEILKNHNSKMDKIWDDHLKQTFDYFVEEIYDTDKQRDEEQISATSKQLLNNTDFLLQKCAEICHMLEEGLAKIWKQSVVNISEYVQHR